MKRYAAIVALCALGQAALAFPTASYYPLVPGDTWTYAVADGTTDVETVTGNTENADGYTSIGMLDSIDGSYGYYTNDANGIRVHQGFETSQINGCGTVYEQDFYNSGGILLLPADANLGSTYTSGGNLSVTLSGCTTLNGTYTASSQVVDFETVTVPAGTFTALKVVVNLTITIDSRSVASQTTFWFVSGIGMIKSLGGDSSSDESLSGSNLVEAVPNAFNFANMVGNPNTNATSNTITVSGINAAAPISISGGQYSVNGGPWTSAAGTVTNGATVQVQVTLGAGGTTSTATLTIGGVSSSFTAAAQTPPPVPQGPQTTADLPTYVPAVNAAYGYESIVRFINTGSKATQIWVARIDGATGNVGSLAMVINSLAPGAAQSVTAQQIEAALGGAFTAADRPRLRVSYSASTTLEAQSFLLQPNGAFNEVSTAPGGAAFMVYTFVPAEAASSGYESYLRVINTGTAATAVNIACVDAPSGVINLTATLIPSLPAGAAVTFTATQVENILGGMNAGYRPTLAISSPTNVPLAAQSFLIQPGGAFTDVSSGQSGASVDVRTYFPVAATAATSSLRIVNTGSSASPVTVALIDDATGNPGPPATLIKSLPVNAAQTLTSAQIESALGVSLAAASRPRLRIAATAGTIEVQSFLMQSGGAFNEMSTAQTGTAVAVRSYVPAAEAVSGYSSALRIINTGNIATGLTVALIDPQTGATGVAGRLIDVLPPGGAVSFSANQIEAALGSPIAAGTRPRLRIAGNGTNILEVQSFLYQPGGAFTEVSPEGVTQPHGQAMGVPAP